ncbi:pyridoxine 5'-phosphate synthase [Zavarzinella formosa]|uniref:pyridoxine 5'-phosphate synthase n=1 Tax=Zavarzinella formosa TaxID=360055 RepID=UPI0002F66B35|nr:pyridoxine 5'-phosphate synthase [Zavarzinella formosa]
MMRLGVNIDHVATVRQARRSHEPDPVTAAALAFQGGADGITIHLREDRRHINDRDLRILRETVPTGLNLEMATAPEMMAIAIGAKPDQITLVPEKRQELTTEGGLDVVGQFAVVKNAVRMLQDAGIVVALFIDPNVDQVRASAECGVTAVEFHTGAYAEARNPVAVAGQMATLRESCVLAHRSGLHVHLGHGLNYINVKPVVRLPHVEELNIGHSIVARAVLVGMAQAVRDMKTAMSEHFPKQV